jgi:hypothetical protein
VGDAVVAGGIKHPLGVIDQQGSRGVKGVQCL